MIDFNSHPVTTAVMSELGLQADGQTVIARARETAILPLVTSLRPELLDKEKLRMAARTVLLQRETDRVGAVLAGIEHTVLKGPDLASDLFGSPLMRSSGDVDVLVGRQDLDAALKALRDSGWAQDRPVTDLESNNQIQLIGPDIGITTEVHWAVALPHIPQPPPIYFMDDPMRPEALLIYLAFHFHNHVGFLKGLLDIAAWWDRYADQADWWEIESITRRYGIAPMVWWPLRTLEILTDRQLNRRYESRIVDAWAGWTADAARGALASSTPIRSADALGLKVFDTPIARRVAGNWLSLSLVEPPSRALRALSKALFLGPEVMMLRDPEASRAQAWGRVLMRPLELIRKSQ